MNYNNFYNYFKARTSNRWNNLCRDVVESPSLDICKMQLDRALNSLIKAPSMKGWTR